MRSGFGLLCGCVGGVGSRCTERSDPPAHELMVSRQGTGAAACAKKQVAITAGTTSSETDSFCSLILIVGKASPLLRSSLGLGRIPAAPWWSITKMRRADERGLRYKAYCNYYLAPVLQSGPGTLEQANVARLRTPCNFPSTPSLRLDVTIPVIHWPSMHRLDAMSEPPVCKLLQRARRVARGQAFLNRIGYRRDRSRARRQLGL